MLARPWLESGEATTEEFDDQTEADRVFMSAFDWYGLDADALPVPRKNSAGDRVFLARLAGQRPKPMQEMEAKELAAARQQAVAAVLTQFDENFLRLDSEWFTKTFEVELTAWERRKNAPDRYEGEDEDPDSGAQ